MRLGQYRLGDGVRGYRTSDGICVDLADVILALDLPVRLDKKLRRATGWALDERRTILIDREAGMVQIMNDKEALAPGDIVDTPEGWCVSALRLSAWIGVALEPDLANALLLVRSRERLPLEAQMERRARAAAVRPAASFDLKDLPRAPARPGGVRAPAFDIVANLGGLREGRNGKSQIRTSYELFAAGEIGPVAYNARLSSSRGGRPETLRVQAYRTDPDARLLGPLKATTVAAGDVSGFSTPLVAQSGAGRGVMLTNRPVDRRDAFDRTDFRGQLPSGWDAELYRNGQLLAFAADRADGRYEFLDVPLLYGQNRFEIVLYGPQGQIRREQRNIPVGIDSIPPRKTYYWAGVHEDGRDLIGLRRLPVFSRMGWRGTFGLERGLDARTSLSALGHSLVLEDGIRRNYAEIAVRRAVGPTLVELSGSSDLDGGSALRAQMLGEFGQSYLNIESILARRGFRSDRVLRDVTGIHSIGIDHNLRAGPTVVPIHFDARYTTRRGGRDSLDANARISASLGRVSLTGQLDWRDERSRIGPDPPGELTASLLANGRLGGVRLRGEARYRLRPDPRFDTVALVAEWSAGGGRAGRDRNDWRAEIAYDQPLGPVRAGMGYIRRFERVAVTASVEAGTDGSAAAALSLAFSLGPDPAGGGLRVTSSRLATQGQVLGTVFRDLNGDGLRQPGEPAERDVQLAAGRAPVERLTGADGRVVIDELEPWQPVLIGIDAASLPDPLIQPATPGLVVVPRPGVALTVDLPLVGAGEVEGTLVRAAGGTLEGVDLELVDGEGRAVRRARSDYDGFFIFEGVPYGRYALRIAALSADAARVEPALPQQAIVDGASPTVRLGIVTAQPRPSRASGGVPAIPGK